MSVREPPSVSKPQVTDPLDSVNNNSSSNIPTTEKQLGEKLKNVFQLMKDGTVSSSTIDEYMPGFKNLDFQGLINSITPHRILANQQYVNKDTVEFEISISKDRVINPADIEIVFLIQFKNAAGNADIEDTVSPVNVWISRLIVNVEIFKLNTEENITPPKEQSIRKYLLDQLKTIPKNKLP